MNSEVKPCVNTLKCMYFWSVLERGKWDIKLKSGIGIGKRI